MTDTKSTAQDESKVTLVTKEGFAKLKEELDSLKNVKRAEVAGRLKEAISYGDLSENSEYEEAKNEQAWLEGRIMELEEKVKYAKIIEEKAHLATVQLGTSVVIRPFPVVKGVESEEYTIVGSTEADPLGHKISNESPVGAALLNKSKGDVVKVNTPNGAIEYEIISLV
jgi:transcription elongation factor GreA